LAGTAVSGATITIQGGAIATTKTLTSSSTGTYASGWIPIGNYTVRVVKTGHTAQSKTTTVKVGATTTLSFTGFQKNHGGLRRPDRFIHFLYSLFWIVFTSAIRVAAAEALTFTPD
jgi:hypothetical protein